MNRFPRLAARTEVELGPRAACRRQRLPARRRWFQPHDPIRDDHAVDLIGALSRDETRFHVSCDGVRVTLQRITPTATAAAPEPDHLVHRRAIDRLLAEIVR